MNLNALASDYTLNALGSDKAPNVIFTNGPVYLKDTAGNFLTDPSGNRLIAYYSDSYTPLALSSVASDYSLNAE